MVIAAYAGSFDPITNGHLWVIETAAKMFDRLLVFVGRNPEKTPMFSPEERVELVRKVTEHIKNVKVLEMPSEALLARFAWKHKATMLVRGIRDSKDYEKERAILHVNRQIQPGIEAMFLMPPKEIAEVSSSLVKGLVGLDDWHSIVKQYVPYPVFMEMSMREVLARPRTE